VHSYGYPAVVQALLTMLVMPDGQPYEVGYCAEEQ
jgi:hypothetical protein